MIFDFSGGFHVKSPPCALLGAGVTMYGFDTFDNDYAFSTAMGSKEKEKEKEDGRGGRDF